jgi:glc operon protein GlcG
MQSKAELGEAEALLAIEACATELRKRGKPTQQSVGDTRGDLLAILRMDGALLPSAGIAANKAFTSSRVRNETFPRFYRCYLSRSVQ